jgi:hypothetical protein
LVRHTRRSSGDPLPRLAHRFDGRGPVRSVLSGGPGATKPLFVGSRTYNEISSGAACLPNGTLGQNYHAYPAGGGLANAESAWLTQLSENASYRSNIAATNTGGAEAKVEVTLYDGAGVALVTFTMTIPAGERRQEDRPFFTKAGRSDLAAAAARVKVTQGSGVVISASVVANISNDPTTFVALR